MPSSSRDSYASRRTLRIDGRAYTVFCLDALRAAGFDPDRLPVSLKILLESLLRREDGRTVRRADIAALAAWEPGAEGATVREIAFLPTRLLLQDFTGVPVAVDLAAMREAMGRLGGDPARINPSLPVDLVIDHSVQVDAYGTDRAYEINRRLEAGRNAERYTFLRWAQLALHRFRVVPPGTGICHQVNLEHLATVVDETGADGGTVLFPDTVAGTDSHTTMINGLGVLGWGVGGIEAEAAMLGQPMPLVIPDVVGVRLTGALGAGSTATDLVLTITERLRRFGVVGKFVEFGGPGMATLSLADRATIANMCPEYGATVGFFPVDDETLRYLRLTGRDEHHVRRVEAYCRHQGLFLTADSPEPRFSDRLEVDLATVVPSLAGPRRPQDRVSLADMPKAFRSALEETLAGDTRRSATTPPPLDPEAAQTTLQHGSVIIAAITSCTNTSNPAVMLAAGLLARKAVERGLMVKPHVKTSLAPGSRVVTDYLRQAGLLPYLEQLKFNLVGYGCTTCIGNSGPIAEPIAAAVKGRGLVVCAVLSGNRNFEGRINPLARFNYLASPPLVVAYALAGTTDIDLASEPLGTDPQGRPVYLHEVWPSPEEVQAALRRHVTRQMFQSRYADVFTGDPEWLALPAPKGDQVIWETESTYVRRPPFFDRISQEPPVRTDIRQARVLVLLGDSVTTDHISPAGAIPEDSPAGRYLIDHGVMPRDFNAYGSRRGNHEVMVRGTFASIRLRNGLAPGTEGGWTVHLPDGGLMPIYDAAERYRRDGVPLIVLAGREYGTGSSRDWAAKGPMLLGVRAVIAESFERIHRSNLLGMGVLPLQFRCGESVSSLGLTGRERFDFLGTPGDLAPRQEMTVLATAEDGMKKEVTVISRLDTEQEVAYYSHGGILPYVLRQLLQESSDRKAA